MVWGTFFPFARLAEGGGGRGLKLFNQHISKSGFPDTRNRCYTRNTPNAHKVIHVIHIIHVMHVIHVIHIIQVIQVI